MAHTRNRHILDPFNELIGFARITGILGHRQVGKSTFTKLVSNEYVTLDDEAQFREASKDAPAFIKKLKGKKSAIDECQLVPALFPALKVFIGTSSVPGRFILTGSVRFTSREVIRESLTGRISNLEMFPLVISEIENKKNSDFFLRALVTESLHSFSKNLNQLNIEHIKRMKAVHQYFETGGLPGLLFIRKIQTRKNMLRDILETILDRDVRLIYSTTLPYQQIYDFCVEIAKQPNEPLNFQEMKRATGLAVPTQKKLLRALESVFLIRSIPLEGGLKGSLYWFEDQVERSFFSYSNDELKQWDWIGLVYRNARAQFAYRLGEFPKYSSYRTRGGAEVPLMIENNGKRIGIFVVHSKEEITSHQIRSAESFLKKYNSANVLFLNTNKLMSHRESTVIRDRMILVPMSVAFF